MTPVTGSKISFDRYRPWLTGACVKRRELPLA